MKKKILKGIGLGLGVSILLSSMIYAGVSMYYKDISAADTTGTKNETEKEDDKEDDVQSNKKDKNVVLHSNAANVAAMTASDTLIPKKVEKLFTIDAPTDQVQNVQGGCVIGDYVYQAFYFADVAENQANNECMIVKCELATGKVVKTSEALQLNHVNDFTYNEKLGYLVIGHNQPMSNLISYVNIDTLEVVDTFPIDYYIYAITYNAARDQYVIGVQGTSNFRILDSEFKAVGDVIKSSSRSNGSTTQGSDCDDDYIYFPFWKSNKITVYDWEGKFVTLIELDEVLSPDDYEPEDITVVDGVIYINCGQGGATIFKVSDFVPKPVDKKEK